MLHCEQIFCQCNRSSQDKQFYHREKFGTWWNSHNHIRVCQYIVFVPLIYSIISCMHTHPHFKNIFYSWYVFVCSKWSCLEGIQINVNLCGSVVCIFHVVHGVLCVFVYKNFLSLYRWSFIALKKCLGVWAFCQ